MTAIKAFCVFILQLGFGYSQNLSIGVIDQSNDVTSPYVTFLSEQTQLKTALYGNPLFEVNGQSYTSSIITKISYRNSYVTLTVDDKSLIRPEDIAFTFRHYQDYFAKTQNWFYYFYSQITNITSTEKTVTFQLKKSGLYNKSHLCVYILKKSFAPIEIKDGIFSPSIRYRGFGKFQWFKERRFQIEIRSQENIISNISNIKLITYPDQSSLISGLIQENIDVYKFDYIQSFVNNGPTVLKNYRRRILKQSKNHLIALLMNDERFAQTKRTFYKQLINRNKILDQYLKYTGRLTNSFYPQNSELHYGLEAIVYDPQKAITGIEKYNYQHQITSKNEIVSSVLIYPKQNSLLEQIANDIVLDLAEARIAVTPVGLEPNEFMKRMKEKSYDFCLQDIYYNDDQYIPLLKFLDENDLLNQRQIQGHIKRLELMPSEANRVPVIHLIQRMIQQDAKIFPMFLIDQDQYLIKRTIQTYTDRVKENEQFYYRLLDFEAWEILEK